MAQAHNIFFLNRFCMSGPVSALSSTSSSASPADSAPSQTSITVASTSFSSSSSISSYTSSSADSIGYTSTSAMFTQSSSSSSSQPSPQLISSFLPSSSYFTATIQKQSLVQKEITHFQSLIGQNSNRIEIKAKPKFSRTLSQGNIRDQLPSSSGSSSSGTSSTTAVRPTRPPPPNRPAPRLNIPSSTITPSQPQHQSSSSTPSSQTSNAFAGVATNISSPVSSSQIVENLPLPDSHSTQSSSNTESLPPSHENENQEKPSPLPIIVERKYNAPPPDALSTGRRHRFYSFPSSHEKGPFPLSPAPLVIPSNINSEPSPQPSPSNVNVTNVSQNVTHVTIVPINILSLTNRRMPNRSNQPSPWVVSDSSGAQTSPSRMLSLKSLSSLDDDSLRKGFGLDPIAPPPTYVQLPPLSQFEQRKRSVVESQTSSTVALIKPEGKEEKDEYLENKTVNDEKKYPVGLPETVPPHYSVEVDAYRKTLPENSSCSRSSCCFFGYKVIALVPLLGLISLIRVEWPIKQKIKDIWTISRSQISSSSAGVGERPVSPANRTISSPHSIDFSGMRGQEIGKEDDEAAPSGLGQRTLVQLDPTDRRDKCIQELALMQMHNTYIRHRLIRDVTEIALVIFGITQGAPYALGWMICINIPSLIQGGIRRYINWARANRIVSEVLEPKKRRADSHSRFRFADD